MITGKPTPKQKERWYWREEMKAAKRAMELYPVGSYEREIYRAKYNEAVKALRVVIPQNLKGIYDKVKEVL